MTWNVTGRMFAQEDKPIKCRGIGCPVSWKCHRWSDLEMFKGREVTLIDGYADCNGVYFLNPDTRITYEGLANVEGAK